ncbi:MAG: phosphatase PAP2 family protein [Candidatus Thermoplasmatota archaeon]|nr:phosphatase PAP2 family protein [Candidatus Thermoplasmatota archaeon]
MDPLYQGTLWFVPSLILLILLATLFFDEHKKMDLRSLKDSLWDSRGALLIMIIVALALQVENLIQDLFEPGFRVTGWVYNMEGVSHIVWLQEHLDYYLLIHASSIFYVLGLSFFLSLIPVLFILRGESELLEEFSKALAVNYMFIIPAYLLIHLMVTSSYKEVEPLLYQHPQYYAIIRATNRQVNCMPSGHISIPFTISLFAMYSAKLKRLAVFGFIFTALTVFVIIYLGVHWLIDIPAGIAVAVIAYWVASQGKLDFIFDRIIGPFERYTEKILQSIFSKG